MKNLILSFFVVLSLIVPLEAFAQRSSGGGFGGGSSRSSGSSFSGGSRSSGSGFGGGSSRSSSYSSPSRSSGSGWGFGSSSSSSSSADKAAYKAQKTGPSFSSRQEAINHFQETKAKDYTTKFNSEPKSRPDYIPTATVVGGKSYNVTYNPQYGGYGYMGPSGWVAYNVMHDAAMLSLLMHRDPVYVGYSGVNTGFGFLSFVFTVVAILFMLYIVVNIIASKD